MAGEMPRGQAALHPLWPEARWNISGLFVFDRIFLELLTVLKDRFDCTPAIDSVHGAPDILWNCGRISQHPLPKPQALAGMVNFLNSHNIGVHFTFSNHLLEAKDLADPICNGLMEFINNGRGLNGVILSSDILYDYIKKRFPDLKLTASIVKVAAEGGKGKKSYYERQCDRFDSVMLHPDDAFVPDLLEELDREKIEIIVNENCVRHCAIRKGHYDLIVEQFHARKQAYEAGQEAPPATLQDHMGNQCLMPLIRLDGYNRSCNLSERELAGIYNMGYRRFKLQGRGDNPPAFVYDLVRFLMEPDLVQPVLYKSFVLEWVTRHTQSILESRRKQ
jgi:hypothetical protein